MRTRRLGDSGLEVSAIRLGDGYPEHLKGMPGGDGRRLDAGPGPAYGHRNRIPAYDVLIP